MTLKVAALSFDIRPGEVKTNLDSVLSGLNDAREQGVQLLALPEQWTTSFLSSYTSEVLEESESALKCVHREALAASVTVVGSAPGRGNEKPTNEIHFLGTSGNVRPYQKRLMFSPTGEGRTIEAGVGLPKTVETPAGRVCAYICYDLRFPEITREAFYEKADIVVIPAQWPHPRTDVFDLLVRARAAENQTWVLACNRSGKAGFAEGREQTFPGTAIFANPMGKEEARIEGGGLLIAEVDISQVEAARRSIPCLRDLKKTGLWPR